MVHKSWLVLMPLMVLLMGCTAHKAATTHSSSNTEYGKFNGVTLDVSRRHYRVSTLRKYIHLVADNHGSFIQLHFSDDKDFAIENNYVGQSIKNARKINGVWHNKKTNQFFYSQAEIKSLVKDAKRQGITLIPEIDTPAHVTALVETMKANGKAKLAKQVSWYSKSYRDEIHLNQAGIQFVNKLNDEVGEDFANQSNARFHLGGDEFTDKVKSNAPYVKYLNATSQNVEKMGFIPEAWNDGFLNSSLSKLNKDIQVTYWSWTADQQGSLGKQRQKYWASMPKLIKHGFKVLNYNDYYLYFNLSKANISKKNVNYMISDMKQYWKPTLWHNDNDTTLKSKRGIVGSSVSLWADAAGSITDQQVYQASNKFIKTFLKLAEDR
ncbi:family 20 glycosylhydrolase [uncultured Lentilactobacillus sp.]|uniref:family 20 glycosylhydrolase n=1 Tax=uncultured Lentilactobacillus sp. TaxID=2805375 RepID=UPI002596E05C|nr:family 20 glycosylhydrolase [uncultured Lentilactobacillus sp.]